MKRSPMVIAAVFNRLLTISVQLVIGSRLGPADVGVFAVAAAYCALFSPFQSSDLARVSLQELDNLERNAMAIQNWLALGCAFMVLGAFLVRHHLPTNIDARFVLVLMTLPLLRVMANTRVALLSAEGASNRVAKATLLEGVCRGVSLVALVFSEYGALSLLLAEVIAVAAATAYLMAAKPIQGWSGWRVGSKLRPKLGMSLVANLLMSVEREYSTFVIGTLCSLSAAGAFYFSNRIASQSALIFMPLLTVEVLPRLLFALRNGGYATYAQVRKVEVRRMLQLGALLIGPLAVVAPVAIAFIWGDRWLSAAWMLPPLAALAALRLTYAFQRGELEAQGNMSAILKISAADALALLITETIGALLWDVRGVIAAFLLETAVMVLITRRLVSMRLLDWSR